MTSADKIRELRARKRPFGLHPRDVPAGLPRALYWKQRRWAAETALDGLGAQPSVERDEAMDELLTATEEHRKIVQGLWDAFVMQRPTFGSTHTARLDASLSQMQLEHKEGRIGNVRVEVMA